MDIVGPESPVLTSAEAYKPGKNTWTSTSNLNIGHGYHTAALLRNNQVLVVSGQWTYSGGTDTTEKCELFDQKINARSTTNDIPVGRYDHAVTLLSDSRVLIAGGRGIGPGGYVDSLSSCELYTP